MFLAKVTLLKTLIDIHSVLWQYVCIIKYIRLLNQYSKTYCQNNIAKIEFCTQMIRLSGLEQGLCLPYRVVVRHCECT